MSDESSSGGGCGGCVGLILFILVMWSLWFGLPIGDKKWNIDIFPPRIWDMNEAVATPAPVAQAKVAPVTKVSSSDTEASDTEAKTGKEW